MSPTPFSTANPIDIVAAFVTENGLELLEGMSHQALHAGAQLRIVTGDYLAFNHVDALPPAPRVEPARRPCP